MKQPWVSIGTDAAVSESTADPARAGRPHPRANGTFPRIIADYVRERGVLTLPDAIRTMTGWPAQRPGLAARGLLRQGMRAAVVIFDLAPTRDRATYEAPTAVPEGIGDVLATGLVPVPGGQVTWSRSGPRPR